MATTRGSGNPQRDLNHMLPAANTVRLGDLLNDMITTINTLQAQLIAAQGAVLPTLTGAAATPVRTLSATLPAPEITGDYP